MEGCHDHIQWMFPLTEPSDFNSSAPLLDSSTIELFRTPAIQDQVRKNYYRFIKFLGLMRLNQDARIKNWSTPGNHNLLRITRVLKCLRLCDLEVEYFMFQKILLSLPKMGYSIPTVTLLYWTESHDSGDI